MTYRYKDTGGSRDTPVQHLYGTVQYCMAKSPTFLNRYDRTQSFERGTPRTLSDTSVLLF